MSNVRGEFVCTRTSRIELGEIERGHVAGSERRPAASRSVDDADGAFRVDAVVLGRLTFVGREHGGAVVCEHDVVGQDADGSRGNECRRCRRYIVQRDVAVLLNAVGDDFHGHGEYTAGVSDAVDAGGGAHVPFDVDGAALREAPVAADAVYVDGRPCCSYGEELVRGRDEGDDFRRSLVEKSRVVRGTRDLGQLHGPRAGGCGGNVVVRDGFLNTRHPVLGGEYPPVEILRGRALTVAHVAGRARRDLLRAEAPAAVVVESGVDALAAGRAVVARGLFADRDEAVLPVITRHAMADVCCVLNFVRVQCTVRIDIDSHVHLAAPSFAACTRRLHRHEHQAVEAVAYAIVRS